MEEAHISTRAKLMLMLLETIEGLPYVGPIIAIFLFCKCDVIEVRMQITVGPPTRFPLLNCSASQRVKGCAVRVCHVLQTWLQGKSHLPLRVSVSVYPETHQIHPFFVVIDSTVSL